jgi:hypothetical protein
MFESCRAHFRRKSGRFAAMTTFAGSAASLEVGDEPYVSAQVEAGSVRQ